MSVSAVTRRIPGRLGWAGRSLSQPTVLSRGLHSAYTRCKDEDSSITSTTVLVQDGTNIEELPAVVRIINGEFKLISNGKSQAGLRLEGPGLVIPRVSKNLFKNINFEEEQEMILGFMRCNKVSQVFKLLEVCPETEVSPAVALAVIKRIFELENNTEYRNQGLNQYPNESPYTFIRGAVMQRLVEVLRVATDPHIVVEALRVMGRDTFQGDKLKYLEVLCNECIVRISEGQLGVGQVCQAARAFYNLGQPGAEYVEQVWAGMTERAEEVGPREVCDIVSVLPLVRKSRKLLHRLAETRMASVWYKLTPEEVIRVLTVMVQLKLTSSRMLPMLARWTRLNIHTLTEGNLRWVVYSFMSLGYTGTDLQQALERFMRARGRKEQGISDPSLVAVVLDYCVKMRLRCPHILDMAAHYFVQHSASLTVPQVNSLCRAYGLLNYQPPQASAFFTALEEQLEAKFVQFPPDVMIDLLLSCVYLGRFPLNFVRSVFNPNFLDRVHTLPGPQVRAARTKLKVLDKALCLEVPHYPGPLLPRDHSAHKLRRDARVQHCINVLRQPLLEVAGMEDRITTAAILPDFPFSELYVIDCFVDMSGRLSIRSLGWSQEKYALLVHPPEHYLHGEGRGEHVGDAQLVGPEVMRAKHLRLIGLLVVHLSMNKIIRYRVYPEKLKTYLQEAMQEAREQAASPSPAQP